MEIPYFFKVLLNQSIFVKLLSFTYLKAILIKKKKDICLSFLISFKCKVKWKKNVINTAWLYKNKFIFVCLNTIMPKVTKNKIDFKLKKNK